MASKDNLLLVNKPKGISSFDVIRILRKKLGAKKMGHAGTLDPLAEGLMLIGVGDEGTKTLSNYLKLPKTYIAEILIGERRTTADMEGQIVEEKNADALNCDEVKKVLEKMAGRINLPVPIFSAVKVKGEPLYKIARETLKKEGIAALDKLTQTAPQKEMEVLVAKFISCRCRVSGDKKDRLLVKAEFEVSSGTYIRSLAEELGARLGYPAALFSLIRTKIGEFKLEEAIIL